MILKKFSYSEFPDKVTSWSIDGLVLEDINLLVGKNATGKTKTLEKISWLGNMLAGRQPQLLNSGNYDVEFTDGEIVYKYKLNLALQKVEFEELIIDGNQKFKRESDGKGQIVAAQFKEKMDFQLSSNQLVVTSKRDTIQHPFLSELVRWAEGQRMYNFSSNMGRDTVFIANDMNNFDVDPRDMNSVISLFIKGEQEYKQDFRKLIIRSMNNIGYKLSNIGVASSPEPIPLAGNLKGLVLYVGEENSQSPIFQPYMSQGMFRALSLIIQISYNTLKGLTTTTLIDDIGEGLDFERSTSVIKLITEIFSEKGKTQVIMSTNDRFVMNNVPLEYWQVIQRDGGNCRVYNYQNSKEIFDKFAYTGLGNFDFLVNDFINAQKKAQ